MAKMMAVTATEPLRDRVLDRVSTALAVGGRVGVRIVMNMSTGLPGNPSAQS